MLGERAAFLHRRVAAAIETSRMRLGGLLRSALFREPARQIEQAAQRLDIAEQSLRRAAESRLAEFAQRLDALGSRVRQHRPDQILALHRQKIGSVASALAGRFQQRLRRERDRLARIGDMLRLLSPEQTIGRGYTITTAADGAVVRSASDAKSGSELHTRFRDGKVISVVTATSAEAAGAKRKKPRHGA